MVREIVSPVSNPRAAAVIVPRVWSRGTELGWSWFAAGQQPSARDINAFSHVLLKKPDYTFDGMGALEQWVERGIAPARVIASHSPDYPPTIVDRTRPLRPYPQVGRCKGSGSIDAAENFECRLP
jgi:hypothetical protein